MISSRCFPADPARSHRVAPGLLYALAMTVGMITSTTAVAQENFPPGFRAMELRAASAGDVAPRMQQILREADPTAEVLVDARRNQLLIRGTEATQRLALDLVQTLDRLPAGRNGDANPREGDGTIVRGYAVPREKLGEVIDRLRARYPANSGVRIAADERTSQLVVVAPPVVQQEIERQLTSPAGDNIRLASGTANGRSPAVTMTESILRLRNVAPQVLEQYLRETWGPEARFGQDESGRVVVAQVPNTDGSTTTLRIDRSNGQIQVQSPATLQDSWRQLVTALDSTAPATEATRLQPVRQADPARVRYAVGLLRTAAQEEDEQPRVVGARPVAQLQIPEEEEPLEDPDADADAEEEPMIEEEAPEGTGLLGDVRIEFIPELGVFIIRGRRADVERVQRIIAEIEEQSRVVQPEIEVVPLQHVNSQALATLVIQLYDNVFAPRQGPLSITALDKPNALLLIGRQETMTVVKELIEKLDEPVAPATQLRVFHLKNLSATDAERLVRGFFVNQPPDAELRPGLGTRARVLAEYRTNALIVQAAPRDMAEVALFIRSIDIEGPESKHEIRIIQLANTLAQDLAPILQGAITGLAVPGQQQQFAPGQQQQTAQQSARLQIRGLDMASHQLIESGALTDVTVTADPNTNSLVIRGPGHTMELMSELIRQLDRPPSAAAQIKVFHLENGDATNLTAMLQLLFGQTVTAGQGNLGQTLRQAFGDISGLGEAESSLVPLRFAVDVRTNSIIASGNAGDLEVVEILLLRLDESGVETRKMFVRRLKNAPAQDVATSIQQFLLQQRQLIQQQLLFNQAVSPFEQIDREVIVVPELVTNSLIVSVTPRLEETIMRIIDDLDFRPPMVMVSVMICEVQLNDSFEFGIELGLQDSLLFDRSLVVGGANVPGFNFNSTGPLGNSAGAASLATRNNVAGQALSNFGMGRTSDAAGYGGLVLSAANESVSILVRALQDAGRLQILSRPQVMALDNQVAFVQVGARVPRITGATVQALGGFQTSTEDVDVGLLLRIQPRINEDGLVVMALAAEKSEVGPIEEGIPVAVNESGEVINSPQINTTTAQTTISAQNGQTVVFAGLITKNRAVRSRRVPFLGDIPIVGRLFRYDAESDQRTELLIFMTPHIVDGESDSDWLNFVESERMSWCLGDVIEMHGDVGLSGGHGLWGPPVSPLIFPDLDPTGTEHIGPPMMMPEQGHPGIDEGTLPSPGMGATSRQLPWRTYVGPAPQPVMPPLTPGTAGPAPGIPTEAPYYPMSQDALRQFPGHEPAMNHGAGSPGGFAPATGMAPAYNAPRVPGDPRFVSPASYQIAPRP